MVFSAIPQVITEDRASGAELIDGSLKFDSGKSTHLQRTQVSGNRRTFTWSGWIKRTDSYDGNNHHDWISASEGDTTAGGDYGFGLRFSYNKTHGTHPYQMMVFEYENSAFKLRLISDQVISDFNNFYHVVIAVDTTIASPSSDRVIVYINGERITNWKSGYESYPSQNLELTVNESGKTSQIGCSVDESGVVQQADGYASNFYLIDGQQLGPGYFGFTDPLTGTWRPKKLRQGDPTVNDGTVWSTYVSGSILAGDGFAAANAFDGVAGTANANCVCPANDSTLSWIPAETIKGEIIEAFFRYNENNSSGVAAQVFQNGSDITSTVSTVIPNDNDGGFITLPFNFIDNVNGLSWTRTASGYKDYRLAAIRVDGVIMQDSTTTNVDFGANGFYLPFDGSAPIGQDQAPSVNDGTVWSTESSITTTTAGTTESGSLAAVFNGTINANAANAYGYLNGAFDFTWTPDTPISYSNKVRVWTGYGGGTVSLNGGSNVSSAPNNWTELVNGSSGTITSINFAVGSGGGWWSALEVDGVMLVDGRIGNSWTPVNFGGTVELSKATGAIPVLNTNGGGTIAESGVRTDKKTYTVTASGGNYYLDGALKPTLNAYRGSSLIFDYTGAASHPLYLSSLPDGKWNSKAYSVEFNGSDYLSIPSSSDFDFGSGDCTVECFVYITSHAGDKTIIGSWEGTTSWQLSYGADSGNDRFAFMMHDGSSTLAAISSFQSTNYVNQWVHLAGVRQGNWLKVYVNGIFGGERSISGAHTTFNAPLTIGGRSNGNQVTAYVSNVRVVKGTALYTTAFTPPGTTLTNVTGTTLLCCQESNVTTAEVSPGTITEGGFPSSSQSRQPFLYDNNHGNFGVNTLDIDTTKITIPHLAADTLYYYCQNHSGMGSSINVTTDIFKADPYAWKCMFAMASDMIDHSPEINVNSTASVFGDIHTTTLQGLRNFYGHSKKMESGGGFRIDMELTTPEANAKHKFDTNDFTLECWHYNDGSQSAWHSLFRSAAYNNPSGTGGTGIAHYGYSQSLHPYSVVSGNGQNWGATGNVVPYKKWHHTAWTRQGGVNRIFANGILVKTFNNSNSWDNRGWEIGDVHTWTGGYQDARIYNGVAKYTESFVVPATEPDVLPDSLSGITGKTNLTKITDGAVAFDGSGDYLTTAGPGTLAASSNWCMECFFYCTGNSSGTYRIMSANESAQSGEYILMRIRLGQYQFSTDVANSQPIETAVFHKWTHMAFTKEGTTVRGFVDGRKIWETTDNNTVTITNLITGWGYSGEYFPGYISNARFVNGSSVYTADFTPPSAPLTNITNTILLCCQSTTSATAAAVIPDGQITVTNNSGTAGAYAPTGLTGGIVFPSGQGTTDHSNGMYLSSPSTSFAGNYTIEFWFNVDTLPSEGNSAYGSVFFDGRPAGAGNADNVFGSIYGYNTTGSSNDFTMRYHANAADRITGTTNLSVGTWYHYALVRNNGTVTQYINGTADGSYSHSTAMISNADRPYIGAWGFGSSGVPGHNDYAVDGKMSNLRMTSTAVYTANFTPPTSNLTAIPGTTFLGLQSTSSATAYTFVSNYLQANGNAAATNFSPFTDDINAIRGQESGYATLNPLAIGAGVNLSDGNLLYNAPTGNSVYGSVLSTIGVSSGKWYSEFIYVDGSQYCHFGISRQKRNLNTWLGNDAGAYTYHDDGNKYNNGSASSYGASYTYGDVIGVAFDADNGTIEFYKNGVSQGIAYSAIPSGTYYFGIGMGSGTEVASANFGQKPFKFLPPDGFQPLNLSTVQPEKVIARPDQYVDVSLWSGNGTSQNITGLKHKPDFVWIKKRAGGSARSHQLFDSVRGVYKTLHSDSTDGQDTNTNRLTAFNQDGFAVGGDDGANGSSSTFVGWTWKAGGNKNTFNIDDVGYANASDVNMSVGGLNSSSYDQSQTWSTYGTTTTGSFNPAITELFDNDTTTGPSTPASSTATWTFTNGITASKSIEIYCANGSGPSGTQTSGTEIRLTVDGTVHSINGSPGWINTGLTGNLTAITIHVTAGSGSSGLRSIKVDGKELVDPSVTVANVPSMANTGCSVGTKQGFSIVRYTGSGSAGTVAHGLGQKPTFWIIKAIDTASNGGWFCYTEQLDGSLDWMYLNGNDSKSDSAAVAPTSTTIGITSTLGEAVSWIAYVWHDVPGLQKFGSYTGNGNADGTFVELGFRPAIVWVKRTDSNENWYIIDTSRDTYNRSGKSLQANTNNGDPTVGGSFSATMDVLSNGFKLRDAGAGSNASGGTYIYCAWAEAPSINLYGAQANAR